jgi:uncharacterized protein YeaO (DUF488 family)
VIEYKDYWIWTIQMARWRYAKFLEIPFFDITVKSGNKLFAPSWDFLQDYRAGKITEAEYTVQYLAKVEPSIKTHPQEWAKFEGEHNIALACYCKPEDFCHRHIFAGLLTNYLRSKNHIVELKGELLPYKGTDHETPSSAGG